MFDMNEEIKKSYLQAGQAVAHALKLGQILARPGTNLADLATLLEEDILKNGAEGLSFPANISLNEEAAHYSPVIDDTKVLPEHGLLKIDLGAHVDGYVADAAITVNLGGDQDPHQTLINAARDALYAALRAFKPGTNVREIGMIIQEEIEKYQDLKPVSNLGGHQLKQWSLHAGTFVPNVGRTFDDYVIQEGDQFAIEPFSTNGYGAIRNGPSQTIFIVKSTKKKKKLPLREKVKIDNFKNKFKSFPFSPRWIDFLPKAQINTTVDQYLHQGILDGYPIFIERANGLVAQAEHTVIVEKDGAIPTTWWEPFKLEESANWKDHIA